VKELRQHLARADDEQHKTRIRVIINIQEGASRTEAEQRFMLSNKTVVEWVKAYNKGGIPALNFSKGGRPEGNPKWDTKVFDALVKEIDKGGQYWSVPLMQAWIKEHKQQEIPESTIEYHLTLLKYSHKSARPHPYKGDKERQETFKKRA
jgi:transposase